MKIKNTNRYTKTAPKIKVDLNLFQFNLLINRVYIGLKVSNSNLELESNLEGV